MCCVIVGGCMNICCKNCLWIVCVVLVGLVLIIGLVLYVLCLNIDFFYMLGEIFYGKCEI